ncbi:MAG: DUF3592 domain-containing protein [Candidatus Omnitrophota bacterium]
MKIRTRVPVPEFIFFTIWLSFSCVLTVLFAKGITKDIAAKGTSPWTYLVLILPVCFVLIGIWGLVMSVRGGINSDGGGAGRFQAKTEVPRGGRIGAFLFGLPFFLVGVCVMIFFCVVPVVKSLNAAAWERVEAQVLKSEVKTNHDSDGNTYKPDVRFRYSYDGYTYESDKYSFISFVSTGSEKSVRRDVRSVPVGSRPMAYVNPKNPKEAVLSVRLSWFYLFTFVFGGIFALVGGLIVFGAGLGVFKPKLPARNAPVPRSGGPQILKSRSGGPVGRFVMIFIVAAIWNGVVSLLFIKDAPFFFKLIFGGIGLILIGAAWHALLALFNPRLEVETDTLYVRLGESFRLRWRLPGKNKNIKKFTVTLVGQEEATYRRGTDTYTDRHIFFTHTIVEQESVVIEESGAQSVTVPADTMYSWKSTNNKIVWFIKFTGVIEKWPDIKEEYEINLLPLKG